VIFTTNGEPDDAGEPGGAVPQVYQRGGSAELVVAGSLEQFGRLLSGFGDSAGCNGDLSIGSPIIWRLRGARTAASAFS